MNVEERAVKVEYENLGLICFICGRVGHNREVCKEGVVIQIEITKPIDIDPDSNGRKNDLYGPWMQVSYGRNGRNTLGGQYAGRRSGNMGSVGKNISSDKKQSPPEHGTGKSGKLSSTVIVTSLPGKESMNVSPSILKDKGSSMNREGSRFAILSEEMDEVVELNRSLNRAGNQNKTSRTKVLAEISNLGDTSTNNISSSRSRYLTDSNIASTSFNKPFKENNTRVWVKGRGKITKKDKQHLVISQQDSLAEDIEDSEVLKSLHKDLINSEALLHPPQPPGLIRNNAGVVDIEGISNNVQQVDVSGATNFELAASELKEAMEVTLE